MLIARLSLIALVAVLVAMPVLAASSGGDGGRPGLWTEMMLWIIEQQRDYHRQLKVALKTLSQEDSLAAAWTLVVGSFLYGVFHAAGPGHGKAVLSSYLLSHGEKLGRSLTMATMAAFCQGLVAIILVYGLIYLAGWLPRETSSAVQWSERLSYFLVAGIGSLLILRALKSGYGFWRTRVSEAGGGDGAILHLRGAHHQDLHQQDAHEHDASCGHSHMPSPAQLKSSGDLATMIGVTLSIGMRPCSGAILVLVFAKAFDISWAGIGAVFAMSCGTAIAVGGLALFATKARDLAASINLGNGVSWRVLPIAVAFAGGVVILALGLGLLSLSFGSAHPLRL